MTVFDTFMYGGPGAADMLECRLTELDPFVDWFVICEAAWTHQGTPKRLTLPDDHGRFAGWLDKIRYIPLTRDPGGGPWDREFAQRDHLIWGLHGARPDDIVLHGDLDEIPDLAGWVMRDKWEVFRQRFHPFAVDWLHPDWWPGTIAARPGTFPTFHDLRARRLSGDLATAGSGWHLSWLGGPAAIDAKMRTYCHLEYTQAVTEANAAGRCWEQGWVPWDGQQCAPVEVDETWPSWVVTRDCPASWFRPRL